jgi:hypothetical protein
VFGPARVNAFGGCGPARPLTRACSIRWVLWLVQSAQRMANHTPKHPVDVVSARQNRQSRLSPRHNPGAA